MSFKKLTGITLALTVLISCLLSGCVLLPFKKTSGKDAQVYLSMAQSFIDKGEYSAAIDVLEEGLGKTQSKEIETLLNALRAIDAQAEATTATTQAATEAATEATTEPTTEPASTQSSPTPDAETQRKVNLFLSNFAEQSFPGYPADDYTLLDFGYNFCKINKREFLRLEGDYYRVSIAHMDTVLMDYFGKTVSPSGNNAAYPSGQPGYEVTFKNSEYLFPAADGELVDYIAVASSIKANGDGTYSVEFDIYAAYEGIENSYYSLDASEASRNSKLELLRSGSAVIKPHTRSTGVASYILLRYTLY